MVSGCFRNTVRIPTGIPVRINRNTQELKAAEESEKKEREKKQEIKARLKEMEKKVREKNRKKENNMKYALGGSVLAWQQKYKIVMSKEEFHEFMMNSVSPPRGEQYKVENQVEESVVCEICAEQLSSNEVSYCKQFFGDRFACRKDQDELRRMVEAEKYRQQEQNYENSNNYY